MIRVPYVSQWDATAKLSRGDCGIVSACMIALWKGTDTTPDAMLKKAGLPVGRLSYTFAEIILAARAVGVQLAARQNVTRSMICDELLKGCPVIPLLRYNEISGNQDDFAGAHFWLCVGFDKTHMIVNDPNWWQPRRDEGAFRRILYAEFDAAIGEALRPTGNLPYQSLFVV